MLKILLGFFTAAVIFTFSYILYVNTNYTSFENFKNQREISVNFTNLPEIILPLKENYTGYQYELLRRYIMNINSSNLVRSDSKFDIEVYYVSESCSTCVVISSDDLLLVTSKSNPENRDVEMIEAFKDININKDIQDNFEINISNNSIDELINNIDNNLVSNTIVTRSTYLFYKKYFPNLKIKDNIGSVKLVWNFPNDDGTIRDSVIRFLDSKLNREFIANLKNKYYSKNSISSYIFIGSRIFISDMITKLPKYESLFKQASDKYNLDWKLLASISYQESKWDNEAISPTGVKGLMMLTKNTAKMLKVNRMLPNESVEGGARYLNNLIDKYSRFDETTKINLALASYNAGPNHINDIILLAEKNNEDIENWNTLKAYLFKLNQKKYYKKMKFGYARGWEAVQYIENVKQYYDIISFLENKDKENQDIIFNEVPSTL